VSHQRRWSALTTPAIATSPAPHEDTSKATALERLRAELKASVGTVEDLADLIDPDRRLSDARRLQRAQWVYDRVSAAIAYRILVEADRARREARS